MADQVTISTFLELRDNLSEGLRRAAAAMSAITSKAESVSQAQIRIAQRTTAALAREDRARSATAIRELHRIQSANQNLNRHILLGSSSMMRALHGVMGVLAAAFGYQAIKSVVNLGREFENLEFRIAGTIRAFNLAPSFGQAQLQGTKVLGVLRDMAARLPGEAEEYAGAFTTALPKIIASGMTDLTKAADFVSRYTAVAISNSVDAAQAGRDLMLMLSGRAGLQVKTFTVLSERIGLTAKEFNKLTKEARLQKIQDALKPFESMLDRVGEGFEAKFGAVKSQVQMIIRLASTPLFAGLKIILSDIEKYLARNKDSLVAMGQVIARELVSGFQKIKEFLFKLPEQLVEIWNYTKLIASVWAGAAIINGVANLVRSFRELRALLVSINLLSAGMGAATAAGAAGAAAATGAAGAAGAAARGLGAKSILGIGAVTAGALAFMYPSAAGGERELAFEAQFKDAAAARDELDKKYSDIVEMLKREPRPGTRAPRGARPRPRLVEEDDTSTIMGVWNAELNAARDQQARFIRLYESLGAGLSVLRPEKRAEIERQRERLMDYAAALGVEMPASLGGPPNLGATAATLEAPKAPADRARTYNDFRHSNFNIKQEFAEGFDPDRIAVAFASDLNRLSDMKLSAAYTLTGGAR